MPSKIEIETLRRVKRVDALKSAHPTPNEKKSEDSLEILVRPEESTTYHDGLKALPRNDKALDDEQKKILQGKVFPNIQRFKHI